MISPSLLRRAEWRFIAAITLLAAIWLTMMMDGGGPLDQTLYEAVYAGRSPALVATARVFTALGEPTILIGAGIVTAIGLWIAGHRHLPLVLAAIVIIGRILTEAQKYWVARVRPGLEPHLVVVKTSSFPSGHATSSMIFYLSLALALTAERSRWRVPAGAAAIILSLLIGTSRVMLGVHWPSDVVGGWAFGLLWVFVTLRLSRRLLEE